MSVPYRDQLLTSLSALVKDALSPRRATAAVHLSTAERTLLVLVASSRKLCGSAVLAWARDTVEAGSACLAMQRTLLANHCFTMALSALWPQYDADLGARAASSAASFSTEDSDESRGRSDDWTEVVSGALQGMASAELAAAADSGGLSGARLRGTTRNETLRRRGDEYRGIV